jgi:GNAT superfamily N-acetyltransferase
VPTPREPVAADLDSLRSVAAACDQTGIQSVYDDRYREHLLSVGRLLVTGEVGAVQAYAGLVDRGGAAYLTDLFVHPDARDAGHGRALLAAMWEGRVDRMTSSSGDPRALSGYARYGARPRWPLLYLRVPGTEPGSAVGPVVERGFAVGDAGWPVDRDDLRTFAVGGAVTAVVSGTGERWRVLRAVTPDPDGLPVLVAGLAALVGPAGSVGLVVPGPHPALPALLERGARIVELDHWCASDGAADVVDPAHELPSPALA